jgi:hypothetical protein
MMWMCRFDCLPLLSAHCCDTKASAAACALPLRMWHKLETKKVCFFSSPLTLFRWWPPPSQVTNTEFFLLLFSPSFKHTFSSYFFSSTRFAIFFNNIFFWKVFPFLASSSNEHLGTITWISSC